MQHQSRLKLSSIIIPMTCAFVGAINAHAAESIQPQTIENEYQDIDVPMSQSNLDEEISVEQAQRERAEKPSGAIEIGVSSYEPNSLIATSRIPNASSFSLVGPPQINLNGVSPFGRDWAMKFGTSFLAMNRTGTIDSDAGDTETDQQTAYVISLRAGVEYTPATLATVHFRPYATAALLPSLVMTSRSSFDDGASAFGVPVELGAGTLVHVLTSVDLNLALVGTLGKVSDSNMDGLGLNAGVRFGL